MLTTSELIGSALALLKKQGWTKGSYFDDREGKYCAVGSIERILAKEFGENWSNDKKIYDLYDSALKVLLDEANTGFTEYFNGFSSVEHFNDFKETEFSDIVRVFQRSIKRLQAA